MAVVHVSMGTHIMAVRAILALLLVSIATVVVNGYLEGPYKYSECVYNTYKAVCLGTRVRRRDCVNCNLRTFPTLTNSETCVMLSANSIQRLPENLQSVRQLVTLDLSRNRIAALPDDLEVMENLEILDLSRNLLRTLSPKTRFPHHLRGLLLAGNNMATIPAGIEIPGLFVFDLSANAFTEIPFHFCVSNELIRVDLTQNPLQNETSVYLPTLNRCKNVNNVPFCVYVDRQDFTCKCPSMYPLFFDRPSFCMGTHMRNVGLKCGANSTEAFKDTTLYDIDRKLDFVRENCSFTLQLAGTGSVGKVSQSLVVFALTVLFTTQ